MRLPKYSILYILLFIITFYNGYVMNANALSLTPKTSATSHINNNNNNNQIIINNNNNNRGTIKSGGELCMPCVDFFNEYLTTIIKVITDYGVIESCSKICGYLNKTVEVDFCDALCDLVGVDEFWKIFLLGDINPIYACQLVTACTVPSHPAVNFDNISLAPSIGSPGSSFNINLNFTVVNQTGVGQFIYIVYYVVNQSKYVFSQTFEGYDKGTYSIQFDFETKNNGSFPLGTYPLELLMCAAECGTHTPYSSSLNQTNTYFVLDTPSVNITEPNSKNVIPHPEEWK